MRPTRKRGLGGVCPDGDPPGGGEPLGALCWLVRPSGMREAQHRGTYAGYCATSASVSASMPARFAASSGLRLWREASAQQELGLTGTGVQWAINAYLLSLAALFAFGGRLADTRGLTKM